MELIDNAKEELKRSDHLIYVSLKYTRTCDIIMNTILRMIESFDFLNLALLEHLKEKKKIPEIPSSALNRAELLNELDKKYKSFMKLYMLMNKIKSAEFDRREEYRKHVTMIVHLDRKELEITVPVLQEYFEKTKEFVTFVEEEIS
ncbi:hypothetical protein HOG16_03075 [Candidatus Woesearchaeota archaeon]|jgi:hypothetical protein|nr:hypothetical protein [Candidatus Woesearchaeota archaeon]MBT4322275.1 hypothetical protein [Candidatus Woesearchaeota archaeon]MBT4630882.1 hypothetical protein [Candidatus Woesearchaeota archaeon]